MHNFIYSEIQDEEFFQLEHVQNVELKTSKIADCQDIKKSTGTPDSSGMWKHEKKAW